MEATNKNKAESVCVAVIRWSAGRTIVPASFASLRYVKRMLSFDHFLMISADAFLLCLVHTLYIPKQKYTHTHICTYTHTGHNISRNSPALNDIIA